MFYQSLTHTPIAEKLSDYFSAYGEVREVSVKKDKVSQKPRYLIRTLVYREVVWP